MKKYIRYTFYEEDGKYIAIIEKYTPKDIIEILRNEHKYDDIRYEE